jgi:hypothetical protein
VGFTKLPVEGYSIATRHGGGLGPVLHPFTYSSILKYKIKGNNGNVAEIIDDFAGTAPR